MRIWIVAISCTLTLTSCTSNSESTTTVSVAPTSAPTQQTTSSTLAPLTIPVFEDDDQPIVTDDEVTIGSLDNGLAYYVRENESPGLRAQLFLVVKAGSVHETPEQAGAAHFLEHMMFNGTERYPANDLLVVLQGFGAEFGPDVNAYTSREETVYQLELPTDDPEAVATGIEVLAQWASAATIDPDEVDKERGVLLEEWRVRDQQFFGRYLKGVAQRLLDGTPYEDSDPLATPNQLEQTTPDDLQSFYETWYRPDRMAVVAVGDFDGEELEQLVIDSFSELTNPVLAAPDVPLFTEVASEPSFFVLADPEAAQAWVELNYPLPSEPPTTVGALRQDLAMRLAWLMIENRLSDDALSGVVPFYDAATAANPLVRTQSTQGMLVFAEPEQLTESTTYLLEEMQRVQAHGFSVGELDRAVGLLMSGLELDYEARNTIQDREYATRYAEHFLGRHPIPNEEDGFEIASRLVGEMTPTQVHATIAVTLSATQPFVIVVSPESEIRSIPVEGDLTEILATVTNSRPEPRNHDAVAVAALMERPSGSVQDRGLFSDLTILELILDNDVRVVLIDTQIREGVVVLGAASPGGWSVLDSRAVPEARLAGEVVTLSGVGGLDQTELERYLADKTVSVVPYIDETEEGLYGQSSTEDLESMLALVHLYMSEPNFSEAALSITSAQYRPFVERPEQTPQLVAENLLMSTRFADDARFAPLPTAEELLDMDLGLMEEVYEDRFDDANDFVFVLAGDFDPDVAEGLVADYLGTLPSGDRETSRDVRPDIPEGVVEKVAEAGTGSLGGLTMLFSTELPLTPETRGELALLEQVLQLRLTETLREELSATYSPIVSFSLRSDPRESVEIRIEVSGDPEELDDTRSAILAELRDLGRRGPTSDEFSIAQEQLRREFELFSNQYLRDTLLFYALHPSEEASDVFYRADITDAATIEQVRALTLNVLSLDQYIEVALVPAP